MLDTHMRHSLEERRMRSVHQGDGGDGGRGPGSFVHPTVTAAVAATTTATLTAAAVATRVTATVASRRTYHFSRTRRARPPRKLMLSGVRAQTQRDHHCKRQCCHRGAVLRR